LLARRMTPRSELIGHLSATTEVHLIGRLALKRAVSKPESLGVFPSR